MTPTPASLGGATPVPGLPTVTPQSLGSAPTRPAATSGAAPTPAPQEPPPVAARPPRPEGCPTIPAVRRLAGLRVGAALEDTPDFDAQLGRATQIRAGWASLPARWATIEPQRGKRDWSTLDRQVDSARAAGLSLLLVAGDAPAWAAGDDILPDDPDDLAAFLGALAGRYAGRVQAYQVWDTPNRAASGRAAARPERYAEALIASGVALRASDPCALVLGGGLLPTRASDPAVALDDLLYYQAMIAYDKDAVRAAYDALAVPLLTGGAKPGDNTKDPEERHRRFAYLSRLRNEQLFQGEGDKQIWATLGWPLSPGADEPSAVSAGEQAEYLADALQRTRERYPFVATILVRGLSAQPPAVGTPDYRLVGDDGAPRPALEALAERRSLGGQPDPRDGFSGIETLGLLWTYKLNPEMAPGSAIGPDDSLRVGSGGPYAYAVDSNGAFRWSYRLGGQQKIVAVATDAEGTAYIGSDKKLLAAVDSDTNTRWDTLLPEPLSAPPAVADDTLYAPVDEALLAFDPVDGTPAWQAGLGGRAGRVAVGPDGTAYIGSADGTLHAIGRDGAERWRFSTERWARGAPLVRADGSVIVATDGGSVFALSPQGQPLWRFDGAGAFAATPAAAPDGTLYVPSSEGVLYALTPDGALSWEAGLPGAATLAPAVNNNGTILVAAGASLVALDGAGAERWRFTAPEKLTLAPQLSDAGLVIVGDDAGVLYGLGPLALRDRLGWP